MYCFVHGVKVLEHMDMCVVDASKNKRIFEEETFKILEEWAKDARLFFDVGAYSGIYSIFAANQGLDVVAFEPNAVLFNRVLDNIALNPGSSNIRVIKKAVSNAIGKGTLHYKFDMSSAGSLTSNAPYTQAVDITTLDNMALVPDIIKIDTERHEYQVLEGAVNILSYKPKLILEVLDDSEHKKVVDFLSKLGYNGFKIVDKRNLICTEAPFV